MGGYGWKPGPPDTLVTKCGGWLAIGLLHVISSSMVVLRRVGVRYHAASVIATLLCKCFFCASAMKPQSILTLCADTAQICDAVGSSTIPHPRMTCWHKERLHLRCRLWLANTSQGKANKTVSNMGFARQWRHRTRKRGSSQRRCYRTTEAVNERLDGESAQIKSSTAALSTTVLLVGSLSGSLPRSLSHGSSCWAREALEHADV